MAKITLPSIASGYNPATINSNFQLIASALNERVLYRVNVGSEPNQMINMLDMNNFRIINLPEPLTDTEPFRKKDGTVFSGQMDAKVALAQGYANQASVSAGQAAVSAVQAASSAASVITAGTALQQQLIATGQQQANDLAAIGSQIAANASTSAVAAAVSAQQAADDADRAEAAQGVVQGYSEDAIEAAAQAQQISDGLAGGTIGFDAIAYDFGMVIDDITYFNRDFGTII